MFSEDIWTLTPGVLGERHGGLACVPCVWQRWHRHHIPAGGWWRLDYQTLMLHTWWMPRPVPERRCQHLQDKQHAFKAMVCFLLINPRLVSFSAESNSDSDFPASNGPLSSWSFYHLSSAESAPPLGDLPELLEPAAWGHSGCGGRASLRPPAAPLPSPFCPTVRPRGGADGHGNPPGARWSHAGAAASPSQGGLSGSLQTGRIGQQQTSQKKLWVSVWIGVRS